MKSDGNHCDPRSSAVTLDMRGTAEGELREYTTRGGSHAGASRTSALRFPL